jgi:hypothetical protein
VKKAWDMLKYGGEIYMELDPSFLPRGISLSSELAMAEVLTKNSYCINLSIIFNRENI